MRLAEPTLTKKITMHILDDINDSIQQYMFMLVTNMLVGLRIALHWIGLKRRGLSRRRRLVHVIPYAGPALTTSHPRHGGFHAMIPFPWG